ncbi:hypothetical protein GCM10010166_15030 [Couchioplanes caeruleus subsp. azureus]|nr:hypothetical protein GCM10010166_15030 [Couchioplanes caeruleus subsp. azureus]
MWRAFGRSSPMIPRRKAILMITRENLDRLDGIDVYGVDGSKIGSAGQVYLDAQTGAPEWVTVRAARNYGSSASPSPITSAAWSRTRTSSGHRDSSTARTAASSSRSPCTRRGRW